MIKFIFITVLLTVIFGILVTLYTNSSLKKSPVKNMNTLSIHSSAFKNLGFIPDKYTCAGENVNPPLLFENIPNNTKSLAVIVDDPDAPSKTWTHWIVYNISPQVSSILEGSFPAGAELGMTDFGMLGYGGPCPPSGTHRYFFKVYALDIRLVGLQNPDKKKLEERMSGHIIASGELIGLYSKK